MRAYATKDIDFWLENNKLWSILSICVHLLLSQVYCRPALPLCTRLCILHACFIPLSLWYIGMFGPYKSPLLSSVVVDVFVRVDCLSPNEIHCHYLFARVLPQKRTLRAYSTCEPQKCFSSRQSANVESSNSTMCVVSNPRTWIGLVDLVESVGKQWLVRITI